MNSTTKLLIVHALPKVQKVVCSLGFGLGVCLCVCVFITQEIQMSFIFLNVTKALFHNNWNPKGTLCICRRHQGAWQSWKGIWQPGMRTCCCTLSTRSVTVRFCDFFSSFSNSQHLEGKFTLSRKPQNCCTKSLRICLKSLKTWQSQSLWEDSLKVQCLKGNVHSFLRVVTCI